MDLLDQTVAVFELTFGNLDSISNLDLKLWVISDGFSKSLIVQEVPLILIVIVKLVKMRLRGLVDLEHLDLLKARAHVLCVELRSIELLVEESISEHHFPPNIEVLVEGSNVLFLAFVLHSERVEKLLWNSNELRLFVVSLQRMESFGRIMVEFFRDPGDQTNHGFLVAVD